MSIFKKKTFSDIKTMNENEVARNLRDSFSPNTINTIFYSITIKLFSLTKNWQMNFQIILHIFPKMCYKNIQNDKFKPSFLLLLHFIKNKITDSFAKFK